MLSGIPDVNEATINFLAYMRYKQIAQHVGAIPKSYSDWLNNQ